MWGIVALAFLVRAFALWLLDSENRVRSFDVWTFGYEATDIGRSLADGLGFGNQWMRPHGPWSEPSGPTAWLPPVYPALLAGLIRLLGGITPQFALVLFTLQAAISSATCALVAALGSALGNARAGRVAGLAFALYPLSVWNSIYTVWDTTLAAFALTAFLWLLFRYGRGASPGRAAWLGACFGCLLWINPAPLSIAPVAAIVVAHGGSRIGSRGLRSAAIFCVVAFAVCVPWMLRNLRVVGAFSMRTNLGVELAVGNNDDANGHYQRARHPSFNPDEFAAYRALGEVPYADQRRSEARAWIASHPLRFVQLSLKRAWIFWLGEAPWSDPRREGIRRPVDDPNSWVKWGQHALCGLLAIAGAIALARRRFEGRVLLAMLVCYPLAYYVTHFMERYRFPIEPLLVLSATWFVLTGVDRLRSAKSLARVE